MQVLSNTDKSRKSGSLLDAMNDLSVCGDTTFKPANEETAGPSESPTYTPYLGIDATMNVIDTKEGPALEIVSNQYAFVDYDNNNYDTNQNTSATATTTPTKNGNVDSERTMNTLNTAPSTTTSPCSMAAPFLSTPTSEYTTMRKLILFKHMQFATIGEESEWEAIGLPKTNNGFMIFAKKDYEMPPQQHHTQEQFVWGNTNTNSKDATTTMNTDMHSIATKTTTSSSSQYTTRVLACQLSPNSRLSLSRVDAIKHLNTLINWDKIDPCKKKNSGNSIFNCNTNGNTFQKCNMNNNMHNDDESTLPPSPTSTITAFNDDDMSSTIPQKQQQRTTKTRALARKGERKTYSAFTPSMLLQESSPSEQGDVSTMFSSSTSSNLSSRKESLRRTNPLVSWDKTAIHEQQLTATKQTVITKKKAQRTRSAPLVSSSSISSSTRNPPVEQNALIVHPPSTFPFTTKNIKTKKTKQKKSLKQFKSLRSCVTPDHMINENTDGISAATSTDEILKDLNVHTKSVTEQLYASGHFHPDIHDNEYHQQGRRIIVEVD